MRGRAAPLTAIDPPVATGASDRFALARIGCLQIQQLRLQLFGQSGGGSLLADEQANAAVTVGSGGERAQIEADHGLLEPAARHGDDLLRIDERNLGRRLGR